jgi:hypothetical protein
VNGGKESGIRTAAMYKHSRPLPHETATDTTAGLRFRAQVGTNKDWQIAMVHRGHAHVKSVLLT